MTWIRHAFLLLVPLVPLVQLRIDQRLEPARAREDALYLWSGPQVRRLCPGFENLMADVYWLRTVQYFGSQRAFQSTQRYELLLPLIDITTTLDPRLEIAYRYGGTFLSEPRPMGAGRPRDGVALMERGVAANPRSWRLRQDLGFARYFFLRDPQGAADDALAASRLPGAPSYLEPLAALFLSKGGHRDSSREIWRRLYEQAEDGPIKDNALFHLRYLSALDEVDRLNSAVDEFARRASHRPDNLAQLHSLGLLRRSPVDPLGVPFAYDRESGKASIARASPLWHPP